MIQRVDDEPHQLLHKLAGNSGQLQNGNNQTREVDQLLEGATYSAGFAMYLGTPGLEYQELRERLRKRTRKTTLIVRCPTLFQKLVVAGPEPLKMSRPKQNLDNQMVIDVNAF